MFIIHHLYNTFPTHLPVHSKVTLPNIRKGLVKVTFSSPSQCLNGSLSKSLRYIKVYFHTVNVFGVIDLINRLSLGTAITKCHVMMGDGLRDPRWRCYHCSAKAGVYQQHLDCHVT